ncbi:MAG: DUF4093 domain-containing protein [Clostridia bacterium]|nr:DUF4093 domain-containing protein [Clostridia bacterium]
MIALSRAVVVEGKYDRARLAALIDAPILQTDGFGIFRDRENCRLLRRYAKERGLIVLTDSDAAGRLIRGHIESIVGKDADVVHLYIPKIEGKERRKTAPSKEGLLGVEGMEDEVLLGLFERYEACNREEKEPLTRTELYEWGLFGREDSVLRRRQVLRAMELPEDLGVNRLLDAINFLYGKERFEALCDELFYSDKNE